MIKRMNVLIVPDEGGQSRRLNLPMFVIKIAAWVLVAMVIVVIAAVLNYSRFAMKALDWNRLATENERLEEENARILHVAREVADSRAVLIDLLKASHENKRPVLNSLVDSAIGDRAGNLSREAMALFNEDRHSPNSFLRYSQPSLPPVRGFLSQKFLNNPLFPERNHLGIDIAGRENTPVVATAPGKVIFEGWTAYFGNCLIIAHSDGYVTFYGHNRQNLSKLTQEVKRGEPIALLGSTGHSTAPHLHFEIWHNGDPVDPLKYINLN